MTNEPTADQVRRYLAVTGWDIGTQGAAATQWTRRGQSIRMPHPDADDFSIANLIVQISMAENRHVADVRDDILDVDNPAHAKIAAWAASSVCENAAITVRRQTDQACGDGWPGVQDAAVAYAMDQQAGALIKAFEATAAVIRAAAELEPAVPWHPLWTAACRAAEVVALAGPERPDDLEEIKRRLDAMRAEAKEQDR